MKKFMFLLAMLVSFIANAYEPMIREDRVWEFVGGMYYTDGYVEKIARYRFEGTENKNNNVYHVLKKETEDGWKPIALMREDTKNGRIYVVLQQEKIEFSGDNTWGSIDIKNGMEIELYSQKEKSQGIDIIPYGYEFGYEEYIPDFQLGSFYFINQGTFNYNEINRKYYYYSQYAGNYDEISKDLIRNGLMYVEGVGNVGYGAPFYAAFPISTPGVVYPCPFRFSRLTDPWGNTVFDARWIFGGSDIESVNAESRPADERKYNLQGVETDRPKPGSIYIQNGEKHVAN